MIVLAGVGTDRLGANRVFRWGTVGGRRDLSGVRGGTQPGHARVAQGISRGVMSLSRTRGLPGRTSPLVRGLVLGR
jgi:hypothetical protein